MSHIEIASTSLPSRRGFLRTSAAAAAATSLPAWFLDECQAQQPAKADGDKPGIALVGCGGMGRGDLKNASRFGRVVALCDVDEKQLGSAAQGYPDAAKLNDFRKVIERKDVDVVICATVDHWHVLVSMAAMRAGDQILVGQMLHDADSACLLA